MEIEAISSLRADYKKPEVRQQNWKSEDAEKLEKDTPLEIGKSYEELGTRISEESGNRRNGNSGESGSSGDSEFDQKRLELIESKIVSGVSISEEESRYLEKYDYAQYHELEEEENDEKKLKALINRASTPEDVSRARFTYKEAARKLIDTGTIKIPDDLKEEEDPLSRKVETVYHFDKEAIGTLLYGSDEESEAVAEYSTSNNEEYSFTGYEPEESPVFSEIAALMYS